MGVVEIGGERTWCKVSEREGKDAAVSIPTKNEVRDPNVKGE